MKLTAKRFVSILLVLVVLFGLLIPAVSAADTLTDEQIALNQTALAYHYKGAFVQYDSTNLTAQGSGRSTCGESRITSGEPAEFAAVDHTLYSVCSDYCFNIYYDAFGYELMGGPRRSITHTMCDLAGQNLPEIIYEWKDGASTVDATTAMAEALALCQAGDLVVGYNDSLSSGHAMYFAGDLFGDGKQYMLHCSGKKIDLTTGNDVVDHNKNYSYKGDEGGGILLEEATSLCFGPTSRTPIAKQWNRFVIMRPTKAADFAGHTLTDHAKARVKFPGIGVDKSTEITVYQSPVTGQELTLTLTIHNHSKEDFKGVKVTEPLPVGASVKAGSASNGGTIGASDITWTIDVPAEGKVDLTYKAVVTAKRLETVTFPGGKVDTLDTRTLTYKVSGAKLSKDNTEKLANLNKKDFKDLRASLTSNDAQFINDVYSEVLGLDLNLPNLQTILDGAYKKVQPINTLSTYGGNMLQRIDSASMSDDVRKAIDMGLREHLGGFFIYTGADPTVLPHGINCVDRTTDYRECFYEPGDVFLGVAPPSRISVNSAKDLMVYVYLGPDKVAYPTEKGLDILKFSNTIGRLFRANIMLVLRPTMGFDDLNTVKAEKLPFTDVKPADWFYSFVKELYGKKIVNGMTDTTFVPNGKLTYGQALKLIVCGLGKGEQATTGSHWASGYLTFAKNQKWLDKDVDLNGPISRLAFCQIAVKAKNLTAQPASNPFKDCADKDVLALVNAGIINGMSADTFAPDNTLTRAQISKIISGLIK